MICAGKRAEVKTRNMEKSVNEWSLRQTNDLGSLTYVNSEELG